jgi:hypothetical protein
LDGGFLIQDQPWEADAEKLATRPHTSTLSFLANHQISEAIAEKPF